MTTPQSDLFQLPSDPASPVPIDMAQGDRPVFGRNYGKGVTESTFGDSGPISVSRIKGGGQKIMPGSVIDYNFERLRWGLAPTNTRLGCSSPIYLAALTDEAWALFASAGVTFYVIRCVWGSALDAVELWPETDVPTKADAIRLVEVERAFRDAQLRRAA